MTPGGVGQRRRPRHQRDLGAAPRRRAPRWRSPSFPSSDCPRSAPDRSARRSAPRSPARAAPPSRAAPSSSRAGGGDVGRLRSCAPRRPSRRPARPRRARRCARRARRACAGWPASPDGATCSRSSPAPASSGARQASATVVNRSFASPCASRAITSAVAGAITSSSAASASWMWPMVASCVRSNVSVRHRVLRQRLQRQRRDELLRRLGHHHAHLGAGFDERAHQLGRLVGRDAARDSDDDAPPGEVHDINVTPARSARHRRRQRHDAARDDEDAPGGRAHVAVEAAAGAGVERPPGRGAAAPRRAARPAACPREGPTPPAPSKIAPSPTRRRSTSAQRRRRRPGQLVAERGREQRAVLREAHAQRAPPASAARRCASTHQPRLDGRAVGGREVGLRRRSARSPAARRRGADAARPRRARPWRARECRRRRSAARPRSSTPVPRSRSPSCQQHDRHADGERQPLPDAELERHVADELRRAPAATRGRPCRRRAA